MLAAPLFCLALGSLPHGMVAVPAGTFRRFLKDIPAAQTSSTSASAPEPPPQSAEIPVAAFALDAEPVTNGAFASFVRAHPRWRRSRIKHLFADVGYLRSWKSDLEPGPKNPATSPVTEVSWFAAKAYCRSLNKRLPTEAEWERAAESASVKEARETSERILTWYGAPTPDVLPAVGRTAANRFGVHDLHALVWEWVLDFNDSMTSDEGRGGASQLFCGSAGVRSVDPSDYATFMRYAFRGSLKARYTVRNLGFRCAKEIHP